MLAMAKTNFNARRHDHKGELTPSNALPALANVVAGNPATTPYFYPRRCGTGTKYFKVRLPVSQQLLFLNLPAVRRHIEWRERISQVMAAKALIATGHFSANTASSVVGMSQSSLSKWLIKFEEYGEKGLMEWWKINERASGKNKLGVLCRINFVKNAARF
jgi:hypothetical protein